MTSMNEHSENATRIIPASEISQYEFCNVAWEMDRAGVPHSTQSSVRMRRGITKHQKKERQFRYARALSISMVILMAILIITTVLMLAGLV
ncbi:MAG: hypothetical protein AAE983_00155 [Thermoplasmataceae archaeon]|jgi:hypothetical protein